MGCTGYRGGGLSCSFICDLLGPILSLYLVSGPQELGSKGRGRGAK